MKNLWLLLLLFCTLLIGRSAQAQSPLGKPEAFKNCNSIAIETKDTPAQVTSKLTQLLEADKYQVATQVAGSTVTRLIARRANSGPAGTQLIFLFYVTNDKGILEATQRHGNTTLISISGYYRKADEKLVTRIGNEKADVVAAAWAIEQQLATAYPDPAAIIGYNKTDVFSRSESETRVELSKSNL